jgi:hypothetical protein
MNKTHDLILGVLAGSNYMFAYPGVEAYLESIRRSGFTGRKVMITWGLHPLTRQALVNHGFEIVDVPWTSAPFFHTRMRVAYEYMKEHYKEFRYVLWLDIKDLILQNDPSVWLEKNIGSAGIIASTECVTIEQEETNRMWAQTILGESKYQEIKNGEVINGGTWVGQSEMMLEVFKQTHEGCSTYAGPYPPCQIWINYVLHKNLSKYLRIPRWSEGFAACLHPCWSPWRTPCWPYMRDPHPVLDLRNCVLHAGTHPNPQNPMVLFNGQWGRSRKLNMHPDSNPLHGVECVSKPEGKPFSIVHGYDRDWDLKALFEYKYRFNGGFDLEAFNTHNNSLLANQRGEFKRELRRPNEVSGSAGKLPQPGRVFQRRA